MEGVLRGRAPLNCDTGSKCFFPDGCARGFLRLCKKDPLIVFSNDQTFTARACSSITTAHPAFAGPVSFVKLDASFQATRVRPVEVDQSGASFPIPHGSGAHAKEACEFAL